MSRNNHQQKRSKNPLTILQNAQNSKILLRTYKYGEKLSKYIEEKRPLIFADEPKTFPGYQELIHISTMPTSQYDSGTWYLYAPN